MRIRRKLFLVFVPAILILLLLAIVAWPSFVKARDKSQLNACHNNLCMIRSAIEATAMGYRWKEGDPTPTEIFTQYMKDKKLPVCPSGGIYIIPRLGQNPTCSVHGDLLKGATK